VPNATLVKRQKLKTIHTKSIILQNKAKNVHVSRRLSRSMASVENQSFPRARIHPKAQDNLVAKWLAELQIETI